jgi:hypothetical protein
MQWRTPGQRADVNRETVLTQSADEALREARAKPANVARGRLLGVGERNRKWRVDVERRRTRLGDDGVSVEEANDVAALDDEGAVERRRKPKRDLDVAGIDVRGEASARVASVRRRERTSVEPRKDHLHACEPTD